MTCTDIGDFLGLTIETVSRTFTKLKVLRLIELAAQQPSPLTRDIEHLQSLVDGKQQAS